MQAAFFDLDKTVINKASMVAFGGPLYRGGLITRRTVLRALWGQLIYLHLGASEQRLARIRESVLTLTRGWERSQVREIVGEALEETVEPIIFSEALELIEAHRDAGRRIFLVSASPEEIVTPLGAYLGSDEVIASRPRVDESGRYTGDMEFYAYGEYKADAMRSAAAREGLDLGGSFAYSDSYTDVPMLEAVGNPVVVNPDRVLLKLARERGWEVRKFERPVRLKVRARAPRRPAAVATAGVAAAASIAAVAAWRRSSARKADQSVRSFLAATTPSATRIARTRSFFMAHKPSPSAANLNPLATLRDTRRGGRLGPLAMLARAPAPPPRRKVGTLAARLGWS